MPPEPLPWDRKDFPKERKHERSESSLGPVARWRDSSTMSSSSHHVSREFARWGSADFRRPGHGKQGGLHLFTDDNWVYGHAPRSSDKMFEDENCRLSVSRGDGKYSRSNRENRGSSNQRDWKGHSWEIGNGSPSTLGRPHDGNNDQRMDDILTCQSHPHSDSANTWEKDQHDNKLSGVSGLGTGQRCERENSLGSMDWKPLKWTRSGSLSSRGSGFSHSSSSKSLGGVESSEAKTELLVKNATPIQSPSGDVAACVTSAVPLEETSSRKKPRLGWGEGLAKYEKKKVEGPDVTINKDGAAVSTHNTETRSLCSNSADKSPRVMSFADCASPATPSSVACSSSPGVEEKSFGKAVNVDNDISNLCSSPSLGSHNQIEGSSFSLEKLDIISIVNLGCSLTELLQSDDSGSVDSSFVRTTAMSKLLVWKGDILKTLEVTESEIDSLENELKVLKSQSGDLCPCPAISCSLLVEGKVNAGKEQDSASSLIQRPAPLEIDSCMDVEVEKVPVCNGALQSTLVDAKKEDIDSPGTATSKFVEPLSLLNDVSPPEMVKSAECSTSVEAIEPMNPVPSSKEENHASGCADDSLIMNNKDDAPVPSGTNLYADICDSILASNKEVASKASEECNKLLPSKNCHVDVLGATYISSWQDNPFIKERFAKRKHFLRFKERVLTLKFRAFQHLWKEDVRLTSIRRFRAKSHKKCELSLRTVNGGYQKYRSSIRSRFSSPAGNLSLVPTMEVVNFTSKLLSDSQVKHYRDGLKMPELILDEKEKVSSRFISRNGLVEDPCAVEKERAMINPWTSEEREIFMDKLAIFGKDFRKIASFLDHKTTADCVEFYYKNHKSDCFGKTKKKLGLTEQWRSSATTYLVPSVKKWNREMNAVSLDLLGAASAMAARADNVTCNQQISSGRVFFRGRSESRSSRHDDSLIERSGSFDILGNERETVAADVLAGICGSLSSEAMSSCITSSIDPAEGCRDSKCQKMDSAIKRSSTSDITENVDDDTCSDESCGDMDPTDWTDEEKSIFIQAVSSYGKDFVKISRCVRTRSRDQCKVFFSKARKCLGLDSIQSVSQNGGTPLSDDVNGGGSDMEDAYIMETSSAICNNQLGAKIDEDLPSCVLNINQDESDTVGTIKLQTNLNSSSEDKRVGLSSDHKEAEACQTEDKPDLVLENGSDIMNVTSAEMLSASAQAQENAVVLTDTEAERDQVAERLSSDPVSASVASSPSSNSVSRTNTAGDDYPERLENDSGAKGLSFPQNNLIEKGDETGNMHTGDEGGSVEDSNITRNALFPVVDTISCSGFSLNSGNLHQFSLVLDPPAISLRQDSSPAVGNMLSQVSAPSQCERTPSQDGLLSIFDLRESKQGNTSVNIADHQQHISGHPPGGSSQDLRDYPLHIPTKKEMNGDISCLPHSKSQSMSNSEVVLPSPEIVQDFLRKCSSSKPNSSASENPLLSTKVEELTDQSRSHSRSLSDTDKPCRNGDFKLFGQILTTHDSDKETNHPRHCGKSSTTKFTGHPNADGNNLSMLKFDCSNIGLENVPLRSYGYWDGNRIPTGFPSLPDSAVLLAKYPAAFGNYPSSSPKVEQQALQAVVKSSECSLNGLSVFPPREVSGSNGGMMEYQMYRNRDSSKVQPFTVDMKQRQDIFSEMQRRNGFEAMSQQGRGIVGMNVMGRGGILVGGPCTGVSDPVAAIKMHYAKTEQYGGQNGGIVREEESWRGKGDIGR